MRLILLARRYLRCSDRAMFVPRGGSDFAAPVSLGIPCARWRTAAGGDAGTQRHGATLACALSLVGQGTADAPSASETHGDIDVSETRSAPLPGLGAPSAQVEPPRP